MTVEAFDKGRQAAINGDRCAMPSGLHPLLSEERNQWYAGWNSVSAPKKQQAAGEDRMTRRLNDLVG